MKKLVQFTDNGNMVANTPGCVNSVKKTFNIDFIFYVKAFFEACNHSVVSFRFGK